jgi:hypothetical protein
MNAKSFAHNIQVSLKSATGLIVKRSHVHELIASTFGCGSHAAMLTKGVLCQMPPALAQRQKLDGPAISRRARVLGYSSEMASAVERIVLAAIRQDELRLLSLDMVVGLLLTKQTELCDSDFDAEAEGFDTSERTYDEDEIFDLDEESWRARHEVQEYASIDLTSAPVISALTSAIERGDGRAHLAMALLLMEELAESKPEDGRYWFDKEQMGQVLSGVEKEWAESYRQRVESQRRAEVHLACAANLQQPDALLLMAERYDDSRFFELHRPQVHADPAFIAQLADDLGHSKTALDWLEFAAEQGNIGAMRELIEENQSTDPLKCGIWYYLAKLHGRDLTKDDYHAIHEDGSTYDDDVGGTLFAEGDDGVELPEAEESIRQLAESRALEMFKR